MKKGGPRDAPARASLFSPAGALLPAVDVRVVEVEPALAFEGDGVPVDLPGADERRHVLAGEVVLVARDGVAEADVRERLLDDLVRRVGRDDAPTDLRPRRRVEDGDGSQVVGAAGRRRVVGDVRAGLFR